MERISATIAQLSEGSSQEIEEILWNLSRKELDNNDYLLKSGQICTQYFFIENGTVRLFYTRNEEEYTVWMGTSGEIFTNLESYLDQSKSRINIQAIEPSVVYTISKIKSDALAQHSNPYNTLLRRTVEIAFVGLSKNVISFQSEAASERYQRVLSEKNWIAKYPLKYISTFIGVTQSTL
ncbi:MAG: cyclic nucleotide-binding domain-containing protein, partial [Bacteroidota bacterium]